MIKRIKWTKLTTCLALLSTMFAVLLLVRWSAASRPVESRWEVTADKRAQQIEVHKVNINTAPVEELLLLPGIGEKLAERIISYREENGPFSAPEDLLLIKGIGESTLADLRDYIELEEVQP